MSDDYEAGYTDPTPGPTKEPVPVPRKVTRLAVGDMVEIGCVHYEVGRNIHGNLILRMKP